MNKNAPILVLGATGYVGGRLIPRLLEAGHRVRALAPIAEPERRADHIAIAHPELNLTRYPVPYFETSPTETYCSCRVGSAARYAISARIHPAQPPPRVGSTAR